LSLIQIKNAQILQTIIQIVRLGTNKTHLLNFILYIFLKISELITQPAIAQATVFETSNPFSAQLTI